VGGSIPHFVTANLLSCVWDYASYIPCDNHLDVNTLMGSFECSQTQYTQHCHFYTDYTCNQIAKAVDQDFTLSEHFFSLLVVLDYVLCHLICHYPTQRMLDLDQS
jgi:hypothetical protein